MFSSVGQFIVKIANLLEAEGRIASQQMIRIGAILLLMAGASVLGVVAILAMAAAIYVALQHFLHHAGALAVAAVMLLGAAAWVGYIARALYLQMIGSPAAGAAAAAAPLAVTPTQAEPNDADQPPAT